MAGGTHNQVAGLKPARGKAYAHQLSTQDEVIDFDVVGTIANTNGDYTLLPDVEVPAGKKLYLLDFAGKCTTAWSAGTITVQDSSKTVVFFTITASGTFTLNATATRNSSGVANGAGLVDGGPVGKGLIATVASVGGGSTITFRAKGVIR
jgi:hypothetical protein